MLRNQGNQMKEQINCELCKEDVTNTFYKALKEFKNESLIIIKKGKVTCEKCDPDNFFEIREFIFK